MFYEFTKKFGGSCPVVVNIHIAAASLRGSQAAIVHMDARGPEGTATRSISLQSQDDLAPRVDELYARAVQAAGQALEGIVDEVLSEYGPFDAEEPVRVFFCLQDRACQRMAREGALKSRLPFEIASFGGGLCPDVRVPETPRITSLRDEAFNAAVDQLEGKYGRVRHLEGVFQTRRRIAGKLARRKISRAARLAHQAKTRTAAETPAPAGA